MTSPVDTSVKFFSSTMPGAPVLNGVAGSLIALLDACLKDGFDTKAITSLVATGGVMTATFAGTHSAAVDSVVALAGVTGGPSGFAGANGEQKITGRPLATAATFATALPDGTYTGSITMKMAPGGWTKPFSGTNKAAYKSADPASTGMFLRIDDTATTLSRVVGYESMTDVDTGLGAFPSALQMAGGGYWPKSTAASAAAVQWFLATDGRAVLFFVAPASGANPTWTHGFTRIFGDIVPFKPAGDNYGCVLSYSTIATPSSMVDGTLDGHPGATHAMPRAHTGLGSSVLFYSLPMTGQNGQTSGNDTLLGPFPGDVDGSLRLSRRWFSTSTINVMPRGEVPGWFHVPQTLLFNAFKTGDTADAAGVLSGRRIVAVNSSTINLTGAANASTSGAGFIDITGPWR